MGVVVSISTLDAVSKTIILLINPGPVGVVTSSELFQVPMRAVSYPLGSTEHPVSKRLISIIFFIIFSLYIFWHF